MADILKFTDSAIIDESVEEYEYHEYEPITGTSLNNGDDVRISIESQDICTHPSESYLIFEDRLTKTDDTLYVNADEVALTNNAIMQIHPNRENLNRFQIHPNRENLNGSFDIVTSTIRMKFCVQNKFCEYKVYTKIDDSEFNYF